LGALLLIYLIIRISVYRLKQANKRLEEIVKERTQEVVKKNKQLNLALKDIQDSISYAKRMQESMLPKTQELKDHFADAFVFYAPRDIVSGDFYWFYHKNEETILAVADCTGHGVPGAFVSMLGYNMLNQIVFEKKETNPAAILTLLNKSIQKVFHHKAADEYSVNDGMDIAILKICNDKLCFAGANRPLLYIDNKQQLQKITPDKKGIGGRTDYHATFSLHTIDKHTVDMCYLFSDGYPDQFGGPKDKKFLIKRFKKMLLKINNLSGEAQNIVIKTTFDDWKKDTTQIDDVLVVGIRL
jgi:serine phosphatase RsbU (regulator of sigma subunit)